MPRSEPAAFTAVAAKAKEVKTIVIDAGENSITGYADFLNNRYKIDFDGIIYENTGVTWEDGTWIRL